MSDGTTGLYPSLYLYNNTSLYNNRIVSVCLSCDPFPDFGLAELLFLWFSDWLVLHFACTWSDLHNRPPFAYTKINIFFVVFLLWDTVASIPPGSGIYHIVDFAHYVLQNDVYTFTYILSFHCSQPKILRYNYEYEGQHTNGIDLYLMERRVNILWRCCNNNVSRSP